MAVWIHYLHCCALVFNIYKVTAQCGGSATTIDATETYKSHIIQYPGSGTYGENLDCSWILQSSPNNLLVYLSVSQLTNGDVLYIYDGTTTAGTSLYSTSPSGSSGLSITVVAHSGASYIRFTSNGVAGTGQLGFTIRYMSAVTDDKGGCVSPVNVEASDTKQYLTSPNFPSKYPASSDCSWTISSKDNCGSLILDFYLLDIETTCSADKVSVTYDGNARIDLCPSNDWNSASDYNTTGTTAVIALTTDGSDQYQGFVMSYMRTGCLTTTTGATGTTGTTTDVTTTDVTTITTVQTTSTTTPAGISTATETQSSSTTFVQATSNITITNSSATEQEDVTVIVLIVVLVLVGGVIIFVAVCAVAMNKNKCKTAVVNSSYSGPTENKGKTSHMILEVQDSSSWIIANKYND